LAASIHYSFRARLANAGVNALIREPVEANFLRLCVRTIRSTAKMPQGFPQTGHTALREKKALRAITQTFDQFSQLKH